MKRFVAWPVACVMLSGTIFASAPQRAADSDYDWIDVATLDVGGRAALSEQEPFVRMIKSRASVTLRRSLYKGWHASPLVSTSVSGQLPGNWCFAM